MTDDELKKWDTRRVVATLKDGRAVRGTFKTTPQNGLYHISPIYEEPGHERPVVMEGPYQLEDFYTDDFVSIEAL